MTALYQLVAEYREAAAVLDDLDLDDQTVADTLEGMTGAIEVKAVNVACVARNLEATAGAIREAEAQMSARRKAIERRAEHLRAYLLHAMQATGIQKIEAPQFRLSVRANPQFADVFEPAQVPEAYMRHPPPPSPTPDKIAIKAALKSGVDVPGCRLDTTYRLSID